MLCCEFFVFSEADEEYLPESNEEDEDEVMEKPFKPRRLWPGLW